VNRRPRIDARLAPEGGSRRAGGVSVASRKEWAMKLSARNVLKGRVVNVIRGQTTAHVKIDVGGGSVVTASVTVEAVDELGLREGDVAYAVIKASDVIVAKD
jgi:molybdopterin-binding protein